MKSCVFTINVEPFKYRKLIRQEMIGTLNLIKKI